MSERIGWIIDNQIILVFPVAQKAQSVIIVDTHPLILQGICSLGEKLPANIYEHLIRFDHINILHRRILKELPRHSSVAASDNQNLPYHRMYSHRYMRHHLIINKFFFFRKNDLPVQRNKFPEFFRIEYINSLKLTLSRKKLLFNPHGKFDISCVQLWKPKLHTSGLLYTFASTCSRFTSVSSVPCMEQPFSFA